MNEKGKLDNEWCVIVCGRSGTGKSTMVAALTKDWNANSVSASSALRNVFARQSNLRASRVELADFGQKLRASNELNLFHDELKRLIVGQHPVFIDGIRFKETYEWLMSCFSRSALILLKCDEATRRLRNSEAYSADAQFPVDHETELSVDALEPYAHLVIDSSESSSLSIEKVNHFIKNILLGRR